MSDTPRRERKLNTTPAKGTLVEVPINIPTESGVEETLGSLDSQIDKLRNQLNSKQNRGKPNKTADLNRQIENLQSRKTALIERQRNAPAVQVPEAAAPVVSEVPVVATSESTGKGQEKKLHVDTAELTTLVQKTRDQVGKVVRQLEPLQKTPEVLRDAYRAALVSIDAANEQLQRTQTEQLRNPNTPAVARFEVRDARNQLQELKADFQRQVLPHLNKKSYEQASIQPENIVATEPGNQSESTQKPESGDFSDIKDTEITFQPAERSTDDTLQFIEDRVAITQAQADADEQRRERVAHDALVQHTKAPELPKENNRQQENVSVEGLVQTTSDTVYPSFEIGGKEYQYSFGEYVLYKIGDRWHVGAVQGEPKVSGNGARIDFRLQDVETKTPVDIAVEKPLKKFKPLDRKKVLINGVDYAIEGGHVGVRGEVEYNLVSRKNEVVPNVDIEMIRNLQEAEKIKQEFSEKISEIETKIAHLATHKAREVSLQFNKIQERLQKLGLDFGSVHRLSSGNTRAMERLVINARREITIELQALEKSINQQIEHYKKFETARARKTMADDMLKEVARIRDAFGVNERPDNQPLQNWTRAEGVHLPETYQFTSKYYAALDSALFEKIANEPGNIVYQEVQRRLEAHLGMLATSGQTDKNLDKRHLLILEQVLAEWSKEEVKTPKLDFEKESSELSEKIKSLTAEMDALTDTDQVNKISPDIGKLAAMVTVMKEDDPKLPLQLLQAWQAVGKIELAIKNFELSRDTAKQEAQPSEEIDLPSSMLFEFLAPRPHEVRKVLELMYLSTYTLRQEDGKNVSLASKSSVLVEENPAIVAAMRDLFTSAANLPKEGMAKLRMMGVRDWDSFKKMWDERYAAQVGMALYQGVAADMKSRALASENGVISSKIVKKKGENPSWIGRLMGAGVAETAHTEQVYEKDEEKLQRVSRETFEKRFGKEAASVSSENLEDMLRMFSAELSIAMRKINIETALNKEMPLLSKMSAEDRTKRLAELIGIEARLVSHMVVEEAKSYYLTQNGHEILRAQIESLERRVGLLGVGEKPEKAPVVTKATSVASSTASTETGSASVAEVASAIDEYDEEIDESQLAEKRAELMGVVLNVQRRLEVIASLKKKHTSAWVHNPEAEKIMPLLLEELQQLKMYVDRTDADKAMVSVATSLAYRSSVEEVMRAGLEMYAEYKRGREKRTSTETVARVEQGLAKIETAGQRLVAGITDKGHRLVISRLRKAAPSLAIAALLGGGGVLLSNSSTSNRPGVEVKKEAKPPQREPVTPELPVEIKIPPVKPETKLPEKQVRDKEIVSVENFLNPTLDNLLSKTGALVPEGHDVKKDLAAAWQQMDTDGYGTQKLRKVIFKAQNAFRDPSITNQMLQALYKDNFYNLDSLKSFLDEQSK